MVVRASIQTSNSNISLTFPNQIPGARNWGEWKLIGEKAHKFDEGLIAIGADIALGINDLAESFA